METTRDVPKIKLSLEDLRLESFVTGPEGMDIGHTCTGQTLATCGLTCTSNSCDGAGPTCSGCSGATSCCNP